MAFLADFRFLEPALEAAPLVSIGIYGPVVEPHSLQFLHDEPDAKQAHNFVVVGELPSSVKSICSSDRTWARARLASGK